MQYEDSVNAYRDIVNAINTAKKDSFAEGRAEGRAEGITEGIEQRNIEIAKKMIERGMSLNDISDMTGLSIEVVEQLK